jgi:hypothetical protein
MNNPVIQQTLVELEDNLLKLESARTQVNNVVEKSEQVITSFKSILKSVESINEGIGIDKKSIEDKLNNSFKTFDIELNKLLVKTNNSYKSVSDQNEVNQQKFSKSVEDNIDNLNESFKTVNLELQNNSHETNLELNKLQKEFEDKLLKLNHHISNLEETILTTEQKIKDLNFKEEFHLLNNKIEKLNKTNQYVFGIGCFIILLTILIFR